MSLPLSYICYCTSPSPTAPPTALPLPMQVLEATKMPNLYERLKGSVELLDKIMKGLNAYLEKKRLYFPRYLLAHTIHPLYCCSTSLQPPDTSTTPACKHVHTYVRMCVCVLVSAC